jgi:hypothetical protein
MLDTPITYTYDSSCHSETALSYIVYLIIALI